MILSLFGLGGLHIAKMGLLADPLKKSHGARSVDAGDCSHPRTAGRNYIVAVKQPQVVLPQLSFVSSRTLSEANASGPLETC